MRLIPVLLAAMLAALPARAAEDMLHKTSPHDVATTVDRLEQTVTDAGGIIVARHDHAAAAEGAGMELRPTTLLIFGNPQNGTPLMQESQTIGLDLPMRMLVYENAEGETQVIYHDPEAIAEAHGIDPQAEVVQRVKGALDKLTTAATAE